MIFVYRYGILPPSQGDEAAREQLRLAHKYRNARIEIERNRRAAVREVEVASGLRDALVALDAAKATLDAALAAAAAERAETGARRASGAVDEAVKSARATVNVASKAFSAKRAEVRDAVGIETERLYAAACEEKKKRRSESGVYWGTYHLVDAAAEQSFGETPMWDRGAPCDPEFLRWSGEGRIGVHVGGADANDLDGSTLVRVMPPTPPPSELARWARKRERLGDPNWMPREGKGAANARDLWLRVGSDGRAPVWAVFPMILHRPIPAGARIKGATVQVKRIGTREEWSALLTIDVPDESRVESCGAGGAVAVHFGWRAMGDRGIRVAVVLDEHGTREEVFLGTDAIASLRVADGIESVRDKAMLGVLKVLAPAVRSAVAGMPERLARDASTLHAWRSPDRLRGFVRAWDAAGAPGGNANCVDAVAMREHTPEPARSRLPQENTVRAFALAWERHDRHLCDYAAGQRVGAQRARRERYRILAARIARTYGVLVLDDADRSKLARREKGPTGEDTTIDRAQSNRVLAAVSELEGALKDAFRSRGGVTKEVPAAGETVTCNTCRNCMDVGLELLVQCRTCDVFMDQDHNAVKNKLDAWRGRSAQAEGAVSEGGGTIAECVAATSKWAKRKAKRAAKASGGGDDRSGV
jgi:hypothetical protein